MVVVRDGATLIFPIYFLSHSFYGQQELTSFRDIDGTGSEKSLHGLLQVNMIDSEWRARARGQTSVRDRARAKRAASKVVTHTRVLNHGYNRIWNALSSKSCKKDVARAAVLMMHDDAPPAARARKNIASVYKGDRFNLLHL